VHSASAGAFVRSSVDLRYYVEAIQFHLIKLNGFISDSMDTSLIYMMQQRCIAEFFMVARSSDSESDATIII